ncbi:hypothetical protein HYZ70_00770 [Candidatus Curtissbacteria bacterium]|nr:hypothetical protein [Candidatus Curtissbacteria bacterium]
MNKEISQPDIDSQQHEPIIPFGKDLKIRVRQNPLRLYFRETEDGGFEIYLGKRPQRRLARAIPWDQVTIARMQRESNALLVNIPTIPVPSKTPSIELAAQQIFSDFIPRFFPFAKGKRIDLYHLDQKRSKEKPQVRIRFDGNLVIVTHPNRELAGSQPPATSHPKAGTQAA